MFLSDVWRLSVGLSVAYIGRKSRTERPKKTKIGTLVAPVTCDWDTTFKVKGQGHQAALLTAVLARQAAARVGVKTCWPYNAIRYTSSWRPGMSFPLKWPAAASRSSAPARPWRRRGRRGVDFKHKRYVCDPGRSCVCDPCFAGNLQLK